MEEPPHWPGQGPFQASPYPVTTVLPRVFPPPPPRPGLLPRTLSPAHTHSICSQLKASGLHRHAVHTRTYRRGNSAHAHIRASALLASSVAMSTCLCTQAKTPRTLLPAGAAGGWARGPCSQCSDAVLLTPSFGHEPSPLRTFQSAVLEPRDLGSVGRCLPGGGLELPLPLERRVQIRCPSICAPRRGARAGCSSCLQPVSPAWRGSGMGLFSAWAL